MKRMPLILTAVTAGLLLTAAGGAAAWYTLREPSPEAIAQRAAEEARKHPPRYVSLDKVVVMLRPDAMESQTRYMAIDLVFKTNEKGERATRDHLPMLRSVAVRSFSALSAAQASGMTVDEFAAEVKRAYDESYAAEQQDRPFSDVLVGKLIIE